MFTTSDDGAHLLFIDAFGVTRLSGPNKIKTLKDAHALGATGVVSRSAAGDRALVWARSWDRVHEVAFPELTPGRKFKRFELSSSFLHPDGRHFVRIGSWMGGDPPTAFRLLADPSKIVARADLAELPSTELPALRLEGAAGASSRHESAVRVAPDGAFALLSSHGSKGPNVLHVGQLGAKTRDLPSVNLRLPLEYGAGRRASVWPSRSATVLWVRNVATGEMHGVRVTPSGAIERFDLRGLGPPVMVDADTVVYRRSEGEVVRSKLDGSAEQVFALPTAAVDTPGVSAGSVMAGAARVYFLPWHGESVFDLIAGREIPRKLPPAGRKVREALGQRALELGAFGRAAHLDIWLEALEIDLTGRSFGFQIGQSSGDGGLLGAMAAEAGASLGDDPALREIGGYRRSHSGTSMWGAPERSAGEAELIAAIGHFDRHRISLLGAAKHFARQYERRLSERNAAPSGEAPLGHLAEKILLRALCFAVITPGRHDLAPRFQSEPLGPEDAVALLTRTFSAGPGLERCGSLGALLPWLLAHHFDAEAFEPLAHLFFEAPRELGGPGQTEAMKALAWAGRRHPERAGRWVAALQSRAAGRAPFAHGLRELEEELEPAP